MGKSAEKDARYTAFFFTVYPRLCRFLRAMLSDPPLAEDLAQESLLRLYRSPMRDAPSTDARNWLFRVARNLALNERKRSANAARLEAPWSLSAVETASTPESELAHRRELGRVWRSIGQLPEQQRAALLLREYEAMSYAEIASVLNVSLDNVKVSIFRARQQVRDVCFLRERRTDSARNTR